MLVLGPLLDLDGPKPLDGEADQGNPVADLHLIPLFERADRGREVAAIGREIATGAGGDVPRSFSGSRKMERTPSRRKFRTARARGKPDGSSSTPLSVVRPGPRRKGMISPVCSFR